MAFRQLREVFNIDAGEYMLSVCGERPLLHVKPATAWLEACLCCTAPVHSSACKADCVCLSDLLSEPWFFMIVGDQALRELPSPGKSGSVFFLSHDDRFIIKTMRKVRSRLYASEMSLRRLFSWIQMRLCYTFHIKHVAAPAANVSYTNQLLQNH